MTKTEPRTPYGEALAMLRDIRDRHLLPAYTDQKVRAFLESAVGFPCDGEGLTMRCPQQCEACAKKYAPIPASEKKEPEFDGDMMKYLKAKMASSSNDKSSEEIQVCGAHTEGWFCGRNHLPAGFDHCIVCCYEEAWKRLTRSATTARDGGRKKLVYNKATKQIDVVTTEGLVTDSFDPPQERL